MKSKAEMMRTMKKGHTEGRKLDVDTKDNDMRSQRMM
jgi:hypothetical protein